MTDHIDTAQERAKLEGLAEHTPGPWDAHGLTVYDTCMDGVASCHTNADARLIAAAPDLLATAHRLLDALDAERARAEKAEGKRDQALARLAMAYESAEELCKRRYHDYAQMVVNAERSGPSHPEYICDSTYHHWSGRSSAYYEVATDIRKLTPADAEATLQRVVDATWNEALNEAAEAAYEADSLELALHGATKITQRIDALKRPEASHD